MHPTEEWICPHCDTTYFPSKEKVKRANKFAIPGPETDGHGNILGDKMPLVSIVENNREPSSSYKKPKLPRSFLDRERHGLRITSYTTTEDS